MPHVDYIKVGDIVVNDDKNPQWTESRVIAIEICPPNKKFGRPVDYVSYADVEQGNVIVDLENGHWARGHKITPKNIQE